MVIKEIFLFIVTDAAVFVSFKLLTRLFFYFNFYIWMEFMTFHAHWYSRSPGVLCAQDIPVTRSKNYFYIMEHKIWGKKIQQVQLIIMIITKSVVRLAHVVSFFSFFNFLSLNFLFFQERNVSYHNFISAECIVFFIPNITYISCTPSIIWEINWEKPVFHLLFASHMWCSILWRIKLCWIM